MPFAKRALAQACVFLVCASVRRAPTHGRVRILGCSLCNGVRRKKKGERGEQCMPEFYLPAETHTLTSALRPVLEAAHPDEFVACVHPHPLDAFVCITAPSERAVREGLLAVKAQVRAALASLAKTHPAASAARA